MPPARLQYDLQQRTIYKSFHHPVMQHRLAPARIVLADHNRPRLTFDLLQIFRPRTFWWFNNSCNERPIGLLDSSRLKLLADPLRRLEILGEQNRPARRAIQPVWHAQINLSRRRLLLVQIPPDPHFQAIDTQRRLCQQPRRLRHRQQIGVLKQNLKTILHAISREQTCSRCPMIDAAVQFSGTKFGPSYYGTKPVPLPARQTACDTRASASRWPSRCRRTSRSWDRTAAPARRAILTTPYRRRCPSSAPVSVPSCPLHCRSFSAPLMPCPPPETSFLCRADTKYCPDGTTRSTDDLPRCPHSNRSACGCGPP